MSCEPTYNLCSFLLTEALIWILCQLRVQHDRLGSGNLRVRHLVIVVGQVSSRLLHGDGCLVAQDRGWSGHGAWQCLSWSKNEPRRHRELFNAAAAACTMNPFPLHARIMTPTRRATNPTSGN